MRIPSLALLTVLAAAVCAPAQDGMKLTARTQNTTRQMSRVVYFQTGGGTFAIPAQYAVSWEAPEWKDEHDKALQDAEAGTRLRLGKNAWVTFDTNRPMTIGGANVPAGAYYVVVEKAGDDKLNLVLLDQNEVRAQHLDAFQTDQTKGGVVIPMKWEKSDKAEDEMKFKLLTTPEDPKKGTFGLAWGPHKLSAPTTVTL